jgi:manganese efflux pump family protein
MMGMILVLGVLAGIDNLQVCSAIGLLPIQRKRRYLFAAAFSGCEILAPIVGLKVGRVLLSIAGSVPAKIGPCALLLTGAVVLFLAMRRRDVGRVVNGRAIVIGLPISLSLDNLIAGVGVSPHPCPMLWTALGIGLVSAMMSCAGLYAGGWTRRFLPLRAEFAVGACICVLALRMLMAGTA